jgi:predicted porin
LFDGPDFDPVLIEGMMGMISRIALTAAAGLLLGAAMAPARAADLGGGCCADLEERVAELEATTARKGNRVVTLQVYGTVAKGLLVWDNGDQSDAYVVDNDAITSIMGFKGEATVKPGVKAGFNIELYIGDSSSGLVKQDNDEGDPGIFIRKSFVYIESEKFGRVSIGQQSTAADGVTAVSLGNTLVSGSPDHSFSLEVGGAGGITLGEFANDFDAGRDDVVRYDSPSIYGFILSAAWGDDDYYDLAVRFAKEWNSVKIAAAIGYQNADSADLGEFEALTGSISVMHVPTGLFAALMLGEKELEGGADADFWYLQAGLERKWFDYGATTIYGEYGQYNDVATLTQDVTSSEAERFGFGVVQHFDSSALDLYAQATFWNFELEGAEEEDMSTLMVGAKIDF